METIVESPQKVVKLYDKNTGVWKFVRKDKGPIRSIELIENMFQKLGLSKNEIRVYVYLARFREQKASEISEALSLHRTETYRILRDLEKRSLVSSVFEKPLKFIATPFERAIDALIEAKKLRIQRLERKKKDLINIWLSLPRPEVKQNRKEVFQILEGEEQIGFKANEIIQNAQGEINVFASEEDLARLYHSGFMDKLERLSKKDFDVKLLTCNSPKSRFFVEKIRLTNMRYALSDVKDVPTFILVDQEQLLLTIRKNTENYGGKAKRAKIAALWTNYGAFVKALGKLFSELWKVEEPLKIVSSS
ncbi:TrmB family transcriptional regulator [Candidatus Bathyarchaeota archaeon]|nr:TrmB family transcriptional regulator [Candidatus Bathyarchaeota archaeon]